MGLDIRLGRREDDYQLVHPRWSYSGFHSFRTRLAAGIGIVLDEMQGFQKDGHDGKPWAGVDSPLLSLLNHSDCDGELSPEDCARVAPALRKAVGTWPDDDYDRSMATLLAEFMEAAARTETPLIFT